ncbi:hypothetical protein M407DRAFT_16913 [Tulasnella calospora MUT 4182]|uniref:Uncharacterized protein n=1 Tax=Tulasnella calospora MUT 4182 TaxID=1051891 RepID=A0A0C3QMV4_9AGAM|nr:hypothetical protein M407DRAFT_16913 [Tulasnella calospora MUT 4182]
MPTLLFFNLSLKETDSVGVPALWFRDPGRVWTTTTLFQLVDRVVFLCVWGYLCLSPDVTARGFVFGGGPWLDLGIYLAVTLLQLTLGARADRCLISEIWLQFGGRGIGIGIDIAFLVRLVWATPSEDDFFNSNVSPPYDQISLVLIYIAIACISLGLLVSASLALIILAAALHELISNGSWGVWRLDVLVLLGPSELKRDNPARPNRSVFTFKGAGKAALLRLRAFLETRTVYRRNLLVEPAWFAVVRGTTALVALAVIFAFGALNVVVNPMQQFQHPLPRRTVPVPVPSEAGFPNDLVGVIWLKRFHARTIDDPAIHSFLDHAVRDSFAADVLLGDKRIPCQWYATWYPHGHSWDMDIGIAWRCSGLREGLTYPVLDKSAVSPIIWLNWNNSSLAEPILTGYVADTPIWEENRPWMDSFGQYFSWNVSVGANVKVNLGRRVIYTRPGSFLEMVGFKQVMLLAQFDSDFTKFEILSTEIVGSNWISLGMELPSQTIIEISPSLDGFYNNNADALEEYLEYTMLEGLAATGGLYTALDLVFALVFGRSIINILFGGKPLSPFGVLGPVSGKILRERLIRQYPGLETDDAPERPKAVCDFLCDFLLDIRPAQPTRHTQDAAFHNSTNHKLRDIQDEKRITEPSSERRSRDEPRETSTVSVV